MIGVTELPYRPRPYQVEAATRTAKLAARRRAEGGRAAGLVVLPTGTGKTRLAYLVAVSMGLRCLFLTHTDALCGQVEEEVARLFPGVRMGVVKADRDEYHAEFILASVPTLSREGRLAAVVAKWAEHGVTPELIVVDEAHHATEDSAYHRIVKAIPTAHVLGLTATPERTDKLPLGDVFPDGVIYRLNVQDAVDGEYLVPVSDGAGALGRSRRVVVPGLTEAVIKAADAGKDPLGEDGKASITDKSRALTPEQKEKLRKAVVKATSDSVYEATRVFKLKTLAFTLNVKCAKEIAAEMWSRGVRCAYAHGLMKRDEYRQCGMDLGGEEGLVAALRDGRLECVVNCQLFLEGFDVPSISGLVWGRPTLSRLVWVQGAGRVMRLDPARPMRLGPADPDRGVPTGEWNPDGKRHAVVWDLVGSHDIHGLQTAELIFKPEEAEAEPEPEVDVEEGEGGGGGGAVDRERDLLLNFVRALSGTRASATRGARVAWLPVEQGTCYVIPREDPDGPTYTIERAGGGWVAFREPPGWGDAPALRLTGVVSEEAAKAACEALCDAGSGFGNRGAGWRLGRPSARMLLALKRLRVTTPKGINAGAAGDAITCACARLRRRTRPERGILCAGAALLD